MSDAVRPAPPSGRTLFVGDLFCDLVFAGVDIPAPGEEAWASAFTIAPGGVATRAVAMARLGGAAVLLSRRGTDALGAHIGDLLAQEANLDTSLVRVIDGFQTPVSVALTGPEDRTFITYHDELVPQTYAGQAEFAAVQVSLDYREQHPWVAAQRRAGAIAYGGVGWDATGQWSPELLARLSEVDVLILNEDEALRFAAADSPREAARRLSDRVPLVVVTLGSAGAIAYDAANGQFAESSTLPVASVDPTGAGDVFTAAFIYSAALPLPERLRFATAAASISVTKLGGASSAPTAEEVVAALQPPTIRETDRSVEPMQHEGVTQP